MMSDLPSIRRLQRLAAALREGKVLPADDAVPLAAAIEASLRGEMGLGAALGLSDGAGKRKPTTILAIAEHTSRLLSIAERYFPNRSAAAQADELHAALDNYRTSAWLNDRLSDECPLRHTYRIQAEFWAILKIRDYVPAPRSLRRVLSQGQMIPHH